MKQRLTWQRRECGTGKSCAGLGRHELMPGGRIAQGYLITNPEVLKDLGAPPTGEGFLFLPDEVIEE
jgi:hypothetical protein